MASNWHLEHDSYSAFFTLPPDPGEAGKATLEGIDSDNDGVRDDIQRYIVLTYPDSAKTRAALIQVTKTKQTELLYDGSDKQALKQYAKTEGVNATYCLAAILGIEDAIATYGELRAQILNTNDRSIAYLKTDEQLSGTIFDEDIPEEEWKSKCLLNSDTMRN